MSLGKYQNGASKHPLGPTRKKGESRVPGARAENFASWIGEGSSRRSNGSIAIRVSSSMGKRASGSARHPSVMCSSHAAVGGGRRRPARSIPPMDGSTSAMGLDESVVRVPPGRTGCIVLRREHTYRFVDCSIFGSRHRARSSRWNELGSDVNGGYALRAPSGASSLKWMRRLFHPKPRYGRDADPLTGVARVEIRCASTFHRRPYPGRVWACSPGEVSLTTRPILDWRPE